MDLILVRNKLLLHLTSMILVLCVIKAKYRHFWLICFFNFQSSFGYKYRDHKIVSLNLKNIVLTPSFIWHIYLFFFPRKLNSIHNYLLNTFILRTIYTHIFRKDLIYVTIDTLQYGQKKPKIGAKLLKKLFVLRELWHIFLWFNYYKIPSGTTLAGNKTLKNVVSIWKKCWAVL